MNITVDAYAKINLNLKILGELPGGYHALSTRMQAVGLADKVYIDYHDFGDLLEEELESYRPRIILHPGKPYLPRDERNLAHKAAALMHRTFHPGKREKIFISVEKNIPVAAGLAGGSADGAAVITGLARLWGLLPGGSGDHPSLDQLSPFMDLAKELGSDVPFSLMAQNGYTAAIGTGRGTELELCTPEKGRILIYTPAFPLSTKAVYGEWKEGDSSDFNDLEPPAMRLAPELVGIMEFMRGIGSPLRTQLSGSGPSIFNVYREEASPTEEQIRILFGDRTGNVYYGELL